MRNSYIQLGIGMLILLRLMQSEIARSVCSQRLLGVYAAVRDIYCVCSQ